MAKMGEGDARWLVEDRADGTNVNGWHWVERDAMEWSKQRLSELFSGITPLQDSGKPDMQFTITGVDTVTGEAVINNRKKKIIPAYELEIKLNWEGSVSGQQAKGKIHFPYVADENHDEDPDMRFVCSTDDQTSTQIKQAFLQGGAKKEVTRLITQFVKELRAGGPALTPSAATPPGAPADATTQAPRPKLSSADPNQLPSTTTATATATATAKAAVKKSDKGRSLNLKEQFYCRAQDVYDCLTQEARFKGFTQSPASIDPKAGGSFSWFGGSVQGIFTEVEPGKRIAMDWRFSSWEDGVLSKVVISLDEPEPGHTILTLGQTGIPEADRFGSEDVLDMTDKGWRVQIFQRIRQVFGYGLGL